MEYVPLWRNTDNGFTSWLEGQPNNGGGIQTMKAININGIDHSKHDS